LNYVKRGGTVFLTSHILEIVERLCDHLGIIHKGKLVASGSIDALRAREGTHSLETLFLRLVGAEAGAVAPLTWLSG
jgi:ABC-2 type transport system ATP-binding protein